MIVRRKSDLGPRSRTLGGLRDVVDRVRCRQVSVRLGIERELRCSISRCAACGGRMRWKRTGRNRFGSMQREQVQRRTVCINSVNFIL
jgi:hypothetical protein